VLPPLLPGFGPGSEAPLLLEEELELLLDEELLDDDELLEVELLLDEELDEDELEELLVDLRTRIELRVAASVLVVSTISSFPSVTVVSKVCLQAVLPPTSA
jgi:hypothetical protein